MNEPAKGKSPSPCPDVHIIYPPQSHTNWRIGLRPPYQGVGRPFNGLPLFFANLSNSFALRCPIFTFLIPPCCFSFTFMSLIGRFPTYLPDERSESADRGKGGKGIGDVPSISFHAFKKSSGSVNAIKPYFALSDKRSRTTLHLM
jgi:hypothetical protein